MPRPHADGSDRFGEEFWDALSRFRPPLDSSSGGFGDDRGGVTVAARVRDAWLRIALAEHASVASFSRFSMQLMALGAPPGLIAEAHRAALDEIVHARVCFALASAYGGEDFGPGPFSLEGHVLGEDSVEAIVSSTVEEGCVGETVSAAIVGECARAAREPLVARALTAIAEDEARHSQFAWACLGWALEAFGAKARTSAESAFERAFGAFRQRAEAACAAQGAETQAVLAAHGHLGRAICGRIELRVIAEVLEPTARDLIAGESGQPPGT